MGVSLYGSYCTEEQNRSYTDDLLHELNEGITIHLA